MVEEYIYELVRAIGDMHSAIQDGVGNESTPKTALFELYQLEQLASNQLPVFGILESTPEGFTGSYDSTSDKYFVNFSLDTWDSPSYVPVTYVIPGPLDQSTAYQILVEHYRDNTTQKLKLFWYSATNPVPELISTDTSYAVSPTEVSLGPELADGIAYLAVAKTQAELETYTDGAPPGDVLVIRSS